MNKSILELAMSKMSPENMIFGDSPNSTLFIQRVGEPGRASSLEMEYNPVKCYISKQRLTDIFVEIFMGDGVHMMLMNRIVTLGKELDYTSPEDAGYKTMLGKALYKYLFETPDATIIKELKKAYKNTYPMNIVKHLDGYMMQGAVNLLNVFDSNYSGLLKGYKQYDILTEGIYDTCEIFEHCHCCQQIFLGLLFILIDNPDIEFVIVNKDYVKVIYTLFYIIQNMSATAGEPLITIVGYEQEKLDKMAIRRLSAIPSVNEMPLRVYEVSTMLNGNASFLIRNAIKERLSGRDSWSPFVNEIFETLSKRGPCTFAMRSSRVRALEIERRNYASGMEQVCDDIVKAAEERIEHKKNEDFDAQKELLAEIESLKKQLTASEASVEKYKTQSRNYSSMIKELRQERDDIEDKLDALGEAYDSTCEELEQLKKAEQARINNENFTPARAESDSLPDDEIEFLRNKKVVILGGHGNFHHLLQKVVPEWRCIETSQNSDYEDVCKNAELVVFMTNYMSHSVYTNGKTACSVANTPFLSLNSNNVNRCLNKVLVKLLES